MHLLRHWWNHPVDYSWAVDYHLSHRALRFTRCAIGVWCVMFAAVAIFSLSTPAGPIAGVPRVAVVALIVSAIVVGAAWIFGTWPSRRLSCWFVVYADIGIATVFASMSEPLVMFPGIALLAVVGSYIATFHGARAFVGHQAFSAVVTAILFVRAVLDSESDAALAAMYLTVVLLLQFSVPTLTQGLLILLRQDATGALFDPLTGLLNRRGLDAELARSCGSNLGDHTVWAVLVIDIDDFKSVNDQHGHVHGDRVLATTASHIQETFGSPAMICRTGGEEFTVVLRTSVEEAMDRARALCATVAGDVAAGVTVSVGLVASVGMVARAGHRGSTDRSIHFEYLHRSADAAMYVAKSRGGNGVVSDVPGDTVNFGAGA